MRKLLSADLVGLWKSMVFKVCMLFAVGLSAFMVIMRWREMKKYPEH